jgi:secreted trypsin-like serine protease
MKQTKLLSLSIGIACLSSSSVFADVSSRIINGQEAVSDKWPFMTALVSKNVDAYNGQFCGASFIGKRYVLTAAHCVESISAEDLDVVIGVSDLAASDVEDHRYAVKNIYMHQNYADKGVSNDIAVLELTEVPQENTIALVDRYERNRLSDGQSLTVMGWGNQNSSGGYSSSSKLYQVDVPLVNQSVCKNAGGKDSGYSDIGDDAFCAGYAQGSKDSCQGDSGGPIVVKTNNSYEQLGIVSWGVGCAQADAYGVYTNISNFESWLADRTRGFSYRANEYLGMRTPGVVTHTFEFGNYSDQVVTVSNITMLSGAAIKSHDCDDVGIGETCRIEVTKDIQTMGDNSFGVQVSTNLAGSETVTSNVKVIGARQLNKAALDLIDIPNSGVLSTEAWKVDGSTIVSPDLSNSETAQVSIQGIPKGTVTLDVSVSSEQDADFMRVYINGHLYYKASGSKSESIPLALVRETNNSIKIAYEKNASVSAGKDQIKFGNLRYTDKILISKSNGTQVAKSGSSGGSFGWHWLLMLAGVGLLRKRH